MQSYYARVPSPHSDGSPSFQTASDTDNERRVARELERLWRCEIKPFGRMCPIDWYAMRDGRLLGVIELKSRSHAYGAHPTVFLNVRKWLALSLAGTGLGCPAILVVRFTDSLRWISVAEIDARRHRIGGCRTRVKSHSDIEPVIEIPVADLLACVPKSVPGSGR